MTFQWRLAWTEKAAEFATLQNARCTFNVKLYGALFVYQLRSSSDRSIDKILQGLLVFGFPELERPRWLINTALVGGFRVTESAILGKGTTSNKK
jgi:hypothetical protein